MSEYLFVYGTLSPEIAPAGLKEMIGKWRSVGRASAPGYLYDLGEYPGAIPDRESKLLIKGEVFRLYDAPSVLRILDAYEGADPDNPAESLFVRREEIVTLVDGRELICWVYVYNRPTFSAPIIANGDYLERIRN